MISKLWMCWLQGREDSTMPELNRVSLDWWCSLNPSWDPEVLSEETIVDYVPEYFDIVAASKFPRNDAAKSDLLRLLLLSKYGGVWADASVFPVSPLDEFIPKVVNETGFFSYRFNPRSHGRETVSWFLAANEPNHYLITQWLEAFVADFTDAPKVWNSGKPGRRVARPEHYYEVHRTLTRLYDTNPAIKGIVDGMVQVSEKIPHSATGKRHRVRSSYMYKRPRVRPQFLARQAPQE